MGRFARVETEGARERFSLMGISAWFRSMEQRLELEREREMSCEGKQRNSCRLIWCVDQRLVRGEL